MRLETLRLFNFRSFGDLETDFEGRSAAIWGPNGRGKTNLLESIFLLGTTRSHRTRKDSELVRFGARSYGVSGLFRRPDGGKTTISLSYEDGGRKRGSIDHKEVDRLASMVGRFGVVFVSPEDVDITLGQPERRRQFLDLTLCAMDPVYLRALQEYNRVQRQRGQLLRDDPGGLSGELLDTWDHQLARLAVPIFAARKRAVEELAPEVGKIYGELGGGEELILSYIPGTANREIGPEEELIKQLRANRTRDLRTGRTSVGPHRDELEVVLEEKAIRNYGSRGQHRTAVLALKIGAARLMERRMGEKPILLLDDVFTELDTSRSISLAEKLRGEGQVFATGTDHGLLERFFPDASRFSVGVEGQVIREQ